jgi:cytochrome c-type biogenesis protein CcsB
MESLVRLSFYCFTATTLTLVGATVCYLLYGAGFLRLARSQMATAGGHGVTATVTSLATGPAPAGLGRFATTLGWFTVAFQALAIVLRFAATRHGPTNMYDFSLIFVGLLALIYMLLERHYGVRQVGAVVFPIALGMAAYIWSLPAWMREVNPVIPALQSGPLMWFHVGSAIAAYAAFSVAFGAAVLYLVGERRRFSWLPSADLLDDLGFRSVTIGFPLLTLTLILGAVWANEAWGAYWQWDPKETAALFLWLVYGVYLHTRNLRGVRGRGSAWILVGGFFAMLFVYYGNYFFDGLHAYGGV